MNKLLTVVVPVYNVERYIGKCLDSLVVPQMLHDKVEVLVINDGTPDNSAEIARKYEKRYPDLFKVIDKENGGHGSAWNLGVSEAKGKYLRFLDSDDWLTNFEEFVRKLDNISADFVICKYEDSGIEDKYVNRFMIPNKLYNVHTFDWTKSEDFFRGYNITNFHVCTYKTELLKKRHPVFLEKAFYDDEVLFVLPLCEAKTFCSFDMFLYNYLLGRAGQTMDVKVMIRNIDYKINVRKQCISFVNKHRPKEKCVSDKLNRIMESRCNDTFYLMLNLPRKEYSPKMKAFTDYISEEFKEYRPRNIFKCSKILGPNITWFLYNYLYPIYLKIKKSF